MAAMGHLGDPYALRSVADLPPPFRSVFGFRYFNSLQSECFPACFLSDVNMVISAPTGSGKTVLFELCILRLLSRFLSSEWRFNLIKGTLKTIYIAPMKALVQEKLRDWNMKLGSLGISCLEMTGDNEFYNTKSIHDADLILTTPEKFDSVSRHGIRDGGLGFFSDIALVLIDEVHLLNDPRGAALEAIVSRIKMLSRLGTMKIAPLANVRLIAVSATIPNIEDIGYAPARNDFLFERRLQSFIFVGYHNGGLCLKDRSVVEGLFLKGDIQILCTTNTLAHGINLPAHTVVIKSTQFFNKEKGLYVEYERSMVLQNPQHYGIKKEIPRELLEKQMKDICVEKIHELGEYGLIWTDEDGFLLKPLADTKMYTVFSKFNGVRFQPGRLMTKFYLKFDTMKLIVKASACCTLEDLLHIICHSAEITWIQLRRNEKKLLNEINADKEGRLWFHVVGANGKRKKRIQTREEKIFILANDCLTGDPLVHDLSLNQEMNSICSNGCRVAKCMREYFIYKKNYKSAISSMLLAKCLHQKLWESSPFLLKQLPGIGIVTAKALKTAGIDSFESLAIADARKIESVTGRNYPFGDSIKSYLPSLGPKIDINIEDAGNRQGKSTIIVTLTRLSQAVGSSKQNYADMVVGSEEDNAILFHEKINPYSVKLYVPCPPNARATLKVDVIFEEYVGLDIHKKHVVSREDFHVTKVFGIKKAEPLYNLPAESCLVSSKTTRTNQSKYHNGQNPLSKEVCVIEDDFRAKAPDKADNDLEILGTREYNNLASLEAPSFTLLHEEDYEDVPDVLASEPVEAECKSATNNTIFDHIRKKSRDFPNLMLSKSMDSSYEPLILKKMKTSGDQFGLDQSSLHAYEVTPMVFDRTEARVSPTNTDERCHNILTRTAETRSFQFTGKMDSISQKSEILNRTQGKNSTQLAGKKAFEKSKTPDENSLHFVGKRDSSSEKSKALSKTPDENSLQFLGKMDSSSEKSKFCFSSPLADFQPMQCTKQVAASVQPLTIQDYCKDILASAKSSGTGASFLDVKSVFSFL
uniref:Helicase ATP-binding domain-containing protein n=1 Tax=Oryza barthii TaxID=65489 RepID=A0A0D3F7N6_9ORYZ